VRFENKERRREGCVSLEGREEEEKREEARQRRGTNRSKEKSRQLRLI